MLRLYDTDSTSLVVNFWWANFYSQSIFRGELTTQWRSSFATICLIMSLSSLPKSYKVGWLRLTAIQVWLSRSSWDLKRIASVSKILKLELQLRNCLADLKISLYVPNPGYSLGTPGTLKCTYTTLYSSQLTSRVNKLECSAPW